MFGNDSLFEKCMNDFEAIENDSKKNIDAVDESFSVGDTVQIKDKDGNTTVVPKAVVAKKREVQDGVMSVEVTGSDDEDKQQWYSEDKYRIIPLNKNEGKNANESKLNEGQFSWHYSDTDEPIYSTEGHQETVWLIDDKGNKWQEDEYEGYGVFGGKDFYALLAEMNGLDVSGDAEHDRQLGIDLVFKDSTTGENTEGVKYPKLVSDPDRDWSSVRNPRSHENQGWYEQEGEEHYDPDYDERDEYDEYRESKKEVVEPGESMTASTDSNFESLVDRFSQVEEDENKNVDEDSVHDYIETEESSLEVIEKDFDAVQDIKGNGGEGIVCLGAGGDPQDWINGVIDLWHDEGIFEGTAEEAFSEVFKLTSTGGRTDLVMVFNESSPLDMGKMAMWRLRFGECSWISDFVDNYASHYGGQDFETGLEAEEDEPEDEFEAKTNEKEVEEKSEVDAENTEFGRKASAGHWAEDVHPPLSQTSKDRFVADVDEEVTDEKKAVPTCDKCNKKHWPFQKCSATEKVEEDVQQDYDATLGSLVALVMRFIGEDVPQEQVEWVLHNLVIAQADAGGGIAGLKDAVRAHGNLRAETDLGGEAPEEEPGLKRPNRFMDTEESVESEVEEVEEKNDPVANDWAVFITKPLKKRISKWLPELKTKELARNLTGVETAKAMSRLDAKEAGITEGEELTSRVECKGCGEMFDATGEEEYCSDFCREKED